ncbi:MAG: hypothetical protein KAH38_01885 [Candidatus Hydrogenedentes bacterium]|nr:hypothetical protein [Candidatus Hydrogenedentota bacterium]
MKPFLIVCVIAFNAIAILPSAQGEPAFLPGKRVLFEAHNCYPYHGLWNNRIDNALSTGFPLAIEIDLVWHSNEETGEGRLAAAHNEPLSGKEPDLKNYFFERVRPHIETALAMNNKADWPLITLNINNIRSNCPAAFVEMWNLTETYASWLCTAVKGTAPNPPAPMEVKPILILSSSGSQEQQHFYNILPEGADLHIFGSGNPDQDATNFRRWLNYSWEAVEPEGQSNATEWNTVKKNRLCNLVDHAHQRGYWIRFYSLNGHPAASSILLGLSPNYNFGALDVVKVRWKEADRAHVDFIATDQIAKAKEIQQAK